MIYPAFVYKSPGSNSAGGGKSFDYIVVNSAGEHAAQLAEGWFDSVPEALEGKHVNEKELATPADDEAAPSRAELEAKAKELGVSFDGRTSDSKLSERIAEAMGG